MAPKSSLLPSAVSGYKVKSVTQREPSPNLTGTLILNFQFPELWAINFCCVRATQSVLFCYSSSNELRQSWNQGASLDTLFSESWQKHRRAQRNKLLVALAWSCHCHFYFILLAWASHMAKHCKATWQRDGSEGLERAEELGPVTQSITEASFLG